MINRFILTGQAQINMRRYVELRHEWNTRYAGIKKIMSDENGSAHFINHEEVTPENFNQHTRRSDDVRKEMRRLKIDLDRRAKFLRWMLKHYQQEPLDPINEWKKEEEKRLQNNAGKANEAMRATST